MGPNQYTHKMHVQHMAHMPWDYLIAGALGVALDELIEQFDPDDDGYGLAAVVEAKARLVGISRREMLINGAWIGVKSAQTGVQLLALGKTLFEGGTATADQAKTALTAIIAFI